MPRETVQDEAGCYDVRVGWAAADGGDVQVGIQTAEGRSLLSVLYGDTESIAKIGHAIRRFADDSHDEASRTTDEAFGRRVLDLIEGQVANYTSVWSTLSRESVNRLIRQLRRARDATFGRDE